MKRTSDVINMCVDVLRVIVMHKHWIKLHRSDRIDCVSRVVIITLHYHYHNHYHTVIIDIHVHVRMIDLLACRDQSNLTSIERIRLKLICEKKSLLLICQLRIHLWTF
jgi:hypothetical protein